MADPVTQTAAALLGAIVGSYTNVLIHRLPERTRQLARGRRSACPSCGAPIPWWLNIPVLSWVLLRGRARCCKAPISLRYPLVEALMALLFLLLVRYPPSGRAVELHAPDPTAILAFCLHAFLIADLIANTFIDLEFRLLLDRLNFPLWWGGLIGSLLVPGLAGTVAPDVLPPLLSSLLASALGLATGYGVCWAVRVLGHKVFGKEAMGLGDVKLMGGVGAFLGADGALLTFFLGCLAGALGGGIRTLFTRDPYLPFGPYLVLGALLTLFLREPLVEFLTVTWPRWQQENASSPWVLGATALVAFAFLVFLVRRGRSP